MPKTSAVAVVKQIPFTEAWGWKLKLRGKTLAVSPRSWTRKSDAIRAAQATQRYFAGATVRVEA